MKDISDPSVWAVWISLVALIASGLSARYARGQAQEARRANDLLDAEHRRQRSREEQEREDRRVWWRVERAQNGYALRNYGTDVAEDVSVDGDGVMFTSGPGLESGVGQNTLRVERVLPHGGAIRFTAPLPSAFMAGGHELLVNWRGRDDPQVVPMSEEPPPPPKPHARRDWRS